MTFFWWCFIVLYGALLAAFELGWVKVVVAPLILVGGKQTGQYWQILGFILILQISLIIILGWWSSYRNKGGKK